MENFDFPYCPDVQKYEKLAKVGQGTFGYFLFIYLFSFSHINNIKIHDTLKKEKEKKEKQGAHEKAEAYFHRGPDKVEI